MLGNLRLAYVEGFLEVAYALHAAGKVFEDFDADRVGKYLRRSILFSTGIISFSPQVQNRKRKP